MNTPSSAPSAAASAPALTNPNFIVDQILPTHSIHLVGGPRGVGKTTFLLQLLDAWRHGRDTFGYQSFPVPFCYVACESPRAAIARTAERIGILDFPIVSLVEPPVDRTRIPAEPSPELAYAMARAAVPACRLLILDGISALAGKVGDYQVVSRFMRELYRFAIAQRLTIIGVAESRKDDPETNVFDRFMGSVAWGAAETKTVIEYLYPEKPEDPRRTVTLLPRNAPIMVMQYAYDRDGLLQYTGLSLVENTLDMWLRTKPIGHSFTTAEAEDATDTSRASVYRWLEKATREGRLEKLGRGSYKVLIHISPAN